MCLLGSSGVQGVHMSSGMQGLLISSGLQGSVGGLLWQEVKSIPETAKQRDKISVIFFIIDL